MVSGILSSVTVRPAWSVISIVDGVVGAGVVVGVVVGDVVGGVVVGCVVVVVVAGEVVGGVVVSSGVVVSGVVQDIRRPRMMVVARIMAPIFLMTLFTSTSFKILKIKPLSLWLRGEKT
jgi:hypothetical protein